VAGCQDKNEKYAKFIAPNCLYLYYQVVPKEKCVPKHEQIRHELAEAITLGHYRPGMRLPSESELVRQFGASRPTVIRALRELQQAGLIDRRVGSGSYVRAEGQPSAQSFGLLIPQLGNTEIFEPICRGMAQAQPAGHHVLLWGSGLEESMSTDAEVSRLCEQFLAKSVAGIFFAPLELTSSKDTVNRRVADLFRKANIPIVLIDRDLVPYPARSDYDLVGIDNRRAGYTIAAHLLSCGARRTVFVCRAGSAPTVDARIAGYREAMLDAGIDFAPELVCRIDPSNMSEVAALLERLRPDGILCANDFTAARLLKALTELGVKVPGQVRLAGIDDVRYASLLSVPLTTIHQPCAEMGATAIAVMQERLCCPTLPARDVLLNFHLVVRESSGARSAT
jgi:DNA-binding LacI/PurR family transcriptional regulator